MCVVHAQDNEPKVLKQRCTVPSANSAVEMGISFLRKKANNGGQSRLKPPGKSIAILSVRALAILSVGLQVIQQHDELS